ncbi:testis-expressed protein 47 [Neopsephotus bourkii]|uniref:testis-expressed protein 47 n=1 Tax=Neopsephotus bourkii TaxID=309878 RepID=UPI002AA57430|nr:testis-expressed protein 47 [Neopsephotus bourkii]
MAEEEAAAAAVAQARPGSAEPAPLERQNLLAGSPGAGGAVRTGPRSAPGRVPLHRLLVLARMGQGAAAPAVEGYHRELLENVLEDHGGEPVSGLLLLYPSRVFHVVEGCSSTIHLLIRELASLQSQGPSALLQDIKVLVVAHAIPTRLFPEWVVAVATTPVTWPSRTIQPHSTAEVVAGCLTLGLKLAASIQSSEDDSEDATESIPTVEQELLIPAETINYLYKAEECTCPEEFLRTYLGPSQPTLDSETVWPVPSYLST